MAQVENAEVNFGDEAPVKRDYIQYLGDPDGPHGTAFLTSHTIPKGDPLWKRIRVPAPKSDLVWERDPLGPAVGQPGNKMLLAVEDLSPEVVEALVKMPGYKRVSE